MVDTNKIKEDLRNLIGKDILETEEEIKKIAKESRLSKTILNKQLEEIKKSELRKRNAEKNLAEDVVENLGQKVGSLFDKKELAKHILELQPCYYDKARNWWLWHWGYKRWERVDETDILNAIEKQATINTINSKEKNEMLEALKQESRKTAPAKIKPTWIQFKDTIVDIKNGENFQAMPHWFVTNPIPYKLHEKDFENTPNLDRIFEEWVGEEHVQTLYEIIAYCMIPDYPIHRIFCLIGGGMNGKSCFLKLLRKFIGEDNVCSTELDTLLSSRFEVTRLHKKLVCQMGETNFNEMNKTSMLKKLSGGDLIGFEYKNKDHFEDKNYAKIIIATNNLPSTSDKTIGFYRRWLILDFPNQFSEKVDILKEIPEEEYESLALKCVYILKELLEKREFYNEGTIEERTRKYEDHSDPLEKFMKEYVIEEYDGYIWKHEFEKKLNEWCKENRFREMSEVVIGKKMKEKGINQSLKTADWLVDGLSKKYRAWVGINWKIKDVKEQVEQEEQVIST